MEPLVVVSAIVVLVYGYRTVIEVIRDMESDGSWEVVHHSISSRFCVGVTLGRRLLQRARRRKFAYYRNFFLEPRSGEPRPTF